MKWASVLSHTLLASNRISYGQLLQGEVVTLIHLPNEVEGFGFVGNDDVDCLAFFLLLVELSSKRDDVGHVGHPCLIESFGGVRVQSLVMTLHQLVRR